MKTLRNLNPVKRWLMIAVLVVGGYAMVVVSILGAGAGAGVLESQDPITPLTPSQQQDSIMAADQWEKSLGMTKDEQQQVQDLGVSLSPALLDAIWAMGKIPFSESAKSLSPSDVQFKPMKETTMTKDANGHETTSTQTVMVIDHIRTYNGVHVFHYETNTISTKSGSTTETITKPIVSGDNWTKDYTPINTLLAMFGLHTKEDRLIVYRQAMAYDPKFGDPQAQDTLLEEIGGGPGTAPKGGPLPPVDITKDIQHAIQLTDVNEAEWLPGMQALVMQESTGNPYAINPKPVYYSAAWGNQQAEGLCQVMPPTFYEYRLPGHEDIWNPVDNTVAAIRYIQADFGTVNNIPGLASSSYGGY